MLSGGGTSGRGLVGTFRPNKVGKFRQARPRGKRTGRLSDPHRVLFSSNAAMIHGNYLLILCSQTCGISYAQTANMKSNNKPIKELNHMKKLFTFVLAAVIALSFSAVGFAQEKPVAGTDQAAAGTAAPAKKAPMKKKAKKAKKSTKKDAMAPASTDAAPAK